MGNTNLTIWIDLFAVAASIGKIISNFAGLLAILKMQNGRKCIELKMGVDYNVREVQYLSDIIV